MPFDFETTFGKLIFELPESEPAGYIPAEECDIAIDPGLLRNGINLPNFSEADVVRHYVTLSHSNFSVDTNFYPFGSCTMKYNPKINEFAASLPGFSDLSPNVFYVNESYAQGTLKLLYDFERILCFLTGMSAFTFQPMAGANGEFCGVSIIAAYHREKGSKRKYIIVPDASHGTNPASAALAGFEIISIPTKEKGYLLPKDVLPYANENLAGVMMTMPNTLGLFNPQVREIADIVHRAGGLMYYDGANFNALIGMACPEKMGFDIVHLNLHKTFATPHGAGGPGSGPVGVANGLERFLPVPRVFKNDKGYFLNWGSEGSIGRLAPFFGNFLVIVKAYAYCLSLGINGLREVAKTAVLNANYVKSFVKEFLDVPYEENWCMHEFVASADALKKEKHISALDIAKALIDKGIHPPTIYFPLIVKEALMIEPTETEPLYVLDEFISALKEVVSTPYEALKNCPFNAPVSRVDEVKAAKDLDICA